MENNTDQLEQEIENLREQLRNHGNHLSPPQLTILRRRRNRLMQELKDLKPMAKQKFHTA